MLRTSSCGAATARARVREIDGNDPDSVRHEFPAQLAEVHPLQVDYPWVESERAEELSVAGIDGVDLAGASSEERQREAAG